MNENRPQRTLKITTSTPAQVRPIQIAHDTQPFTMKTIVSIACLLALVCAAAPNCEARPKRSVIYTSPVVAAAPAVVASVPVASSVVHTHPHTVVKTEQVHAGDHSSYSYSVNSAPVVHTHTAVASAPVVATAAVHHAAVPAYTYGSYGYYPAVSSYAHYSPYHYVVGK